MMKHVSNKLKKLLYCTPLLLLTACGGGDGDVTSESNSNRDVSTTSTVVESYLAMEPICGEMAFARGATSNETSLNDFGHSTSFWQTHEDKAAPFSTIFSDAGWSPLLLKTASLGGAYSYNSINTSVDSTEASVMCNVVRSLLFSTGIGDNDRRAYTTLLIYLSDFDFPSEPWNGAARDEGVEASVEMQLNYTTAIREIGEDGRVYWVDPSFQYFPMRVSCEVPFKVEEFTRSVSVTSSEAINLPDTFCYLQQVQGEEDFYSCLALTGVHSGSECTYVVENKPFTPLATGIESIISFGGKIDLAPEEDWPGRPAYRMTMDKFKISN